MVFCEVIHAQETIAIGRAVVYYEQAAQALSAGIICWHCSDNPSRCHIRSVAWRSENRYTSI